MVLDRIRVFMSDAGRTRYPLSCDPLFRIDNMRDPAGIFRDNPKISQSRIFRGAMP